MITPMSTLPCLYCDGPIPATEAERASLCPLCSRPLTVCGRYRLKELLSKSEHDRVYSAVGDRGEVAVKVVLARDDDWATISEFERMARTLQSSKSKVAPQIFGWEKGGLGRLIIAREKLQGHTLEDRVRGGQRPNAAQWRKLLEDLLSLLSDLHRLTPPLLHRDIRPANILFREAGNWWPVLVDFDPRAGSATVASDLQALGRTIAFAGGAGPVVDKLMDGRLASASDALNALRQDQNRDPDPPRAVNKPPAPRDESKPQKKVWPFIVLGLLISLGQFARFANQSKKENPGPDPPKSSDSTAQRYRRECDSGNGSSCYYLGYRYEKGNGVTKSDVEAAKVYAKGCTLAEKMACNNLGVLYETGRGVPKDGVRAAALYGKACDAQDWLACRNQGYLYSNGIGVAQDGPKAVALYTRACNHGEVKACYNLGWVLDHGKGVPVDIGRAMELYIQACDGEDWVGCTGAGWLYENGKGVPVDIGRARDLYQKACDHNEATGCNNLGAFYAKGSGPPKNNDKAFKLYTKACDGGDHYGCCNLGFFYEKGTATGKDLERATGLYQKSCVLGYDKCCVNFLDMLKGSTHDTALALMKQACDEGNQWNCDQLAKVK
jgi:TPR repeat protein